MKLIAVLSVFLLSVQLHATPIQKRSNNEELPKLPPNPELSARPIRGLQEDNESIADNIIKINTENHLDLYEGDIVLTEKDTGEVDTSETGDVDGSLGRDRGKRNAMRSRQVLWTNKVVPYTFDPSLPPEFHGTIREAIGEFHLHTCLKFKQRTNEPIWILFTHEEGCWSSVGKKYWRTNYSQKVSLGVGCNVKGTILHEIMHAIGFWHEQSRPDRNQYVEVLWENIQEERSHNFNKYGHDNVDRLQVPYDYDSIMHYGTKGFSKNGKETLRAIHDPNRVIGQRTGFSPLDTREINALYDCANKVPGWSAWTAYGPCDIDCRKYRQRFCASNNPAVDCPGNQDYGVQIDEGTCTKQECHAAVHGHWGRWSSWGTCSSPCGTGKYTRTRKCTDPPPKHGGQDCEGSPVQSKDCILRRCGLGPDDCEFDYDGFCYWTNDPLNPRLFDWLRITGSTPSYNTGPAGDHTTGKSQYLYMESSSPAQQGYKARLQSKEFPSTSGRCLSFWYHMYGSAVGKLNVYMKDKTGVLRKLWGLQGDQGNKWQKARVSLFSKSEYQVVIEGVRGRSFTGDIGIDDIKFEEKPCLRPLGCYQERKSSPALPVLLKSLRERIDWWHMDKTVHQCAQLVYDKGYRIFGIQFYGECWSGDKSQVHYDKYGPAKGGKCWSGVGGSDVNYVYEIL